MNSEKETSSKYYVYVYFDPTKESETTICGVHYNMLPFYVGKGCRSRYISHLKEALNETITDHNLKINKIRKMLKNNITPIIIKVATGLSNTEALSLEKKLIEEIGTIIEIPGIPRGSLTNVKSGEVKGHIRVASPSRETLEKMSTARTERWQNPLYREDLLEQARSQTSKLSLAYKSDPEYKENWLLAIRTAANTESNREKKRESATRFWSIPENREKRLKSIREANAKRWTTEAREEKRKQNMKMWEDPNHRKKIAESNSTRWEDSEWATKTKKNISDGKKRSHDGDLCE